MKRIITAILIFAFAVFPSFASIDSELESAKAELKQLAREQVKPVVLTKYPIGSVYQTHEDVSAEDVADMLGGEWREISYAFLWATDGTQDYTVDEDGNFVDDDTGEAIDPLHKISERGGSEHYAFVIGMGQSDDSLAFWTDEESVYGTVTSVLSGVGATASIANAAVVTDNDAPQMRIMPPYTVVRTFERIG